MGLRDLFKRRKTTDIESPIGMGDDEEHEAGEGGPSFYKQELAEYRWAAQHEAVNVARRGIDPERWDDGRMAFEHERALAHAHEGLRDRLASYTGQRVRDEVRELYSLAGTVAQVRDELRTVDHELVQVTKDCKIKHQEVADDELELGRYYRMRSQRALIVKYLIAVIFVVAEFIISGLVFERIFEDLPPGLGYILAFGVTLALIIIPHYTALGLKEGLTQYHVFEKRALEKAGEAAGEDLERSVHVEEMDDRGFRRAAYFVGAGLLVMIVPLSWIRATNEGEFSWAAFFFLLLLQYALSGYFFLREWLDHGHLSHSLHKMDEAKRLVEKTRASILSDLDDAVTEFHDEAEDLIFTIQQAPRWDSHIVQEYLTTVSTFRHLIQLEHPEYEQFITWARKPYLGSKDGMAEGGYPLDPVSEEHLSLEEDGPLGREWWLRTITDALRQATPAGPDGEGEGDEGADDGALVDASWLVTKSPDVLLAEFLRRYFDLEPTYKRPEGIDEPDLDDPEEPPAPDEANEPKPAPGSDAGARRLQAVSGDADAGEPDEETK